MTLEQLDGIVERITYTNEENGYTVLRLHPVGQIMKGTNKDGLITVVGIMQSLYPGMSVALHGQWKTHKKHGRQFEVKSVEEKAPATIEGLRRYLSSGLIKGVGQVTAGRVVDHFGMETLRILDEEPERLEDVPGIGKHRAGLIQKGWLEQREIRNVMLYLKEHRVSTQLAVTIYKMYGDDSISLIQSDPYRLARDIHGVGFKTADQIARNIGLEPDSPERVQAGLVYALQTLNEEGHVYVPASLAVKTTVELLDVLASLCEAALDSLAETQQIYITEFPEEQITAVYLPIMYHSERGVARRLLELDHSVSRLNKGRIQYWQEKQSKDGAMAQLSEQQQGAVHHVLTSKISVLTGGPGTGKTTTLRAVIEALEAVDADYHLASPTGKAAKRLQEATGRDASTIHRLLKFKPPHGFSFNEKNPLKTDMLIIDEASMLDLVLFYSVLRALPDGAHLLLVGDVDQLPSVGPGTVLNDVIRSGMAHITALSMIFRQSEGSRISSNAHRINQGQLPELDNKGDDFFLFPREEPDAAADMVVELVTERIPKRFGFKSISDIQVLVPMYRGSVGAIALNERLQSALNPATKKREQKQIGGRLFRVGDKVMHTRNNYNLEVFNGDSGIIEDIDLVQQQMRVRIDNRLVLYDWSDCRELVHAYAISVHRSQGSEFPVVVVPVMTQHFHMLQRNLLYTAITRARELVVIVGTVKAIAIAVKNNQIEKRYSGLVWRLGE